MMLDSFFNLAADDNTIAIRCRDRSYKYRELYDVVNRIANYFLKLGVRQDDIVAINILDPVAVMFCMFGCLRAGAAFLYLNPRLPEERKKYIISDSRVKYIIDDFPNLQNISSCFTNIIISTDCSAYIIYTSGTTGFPKGVVITRSGLDNYLAHCLDYYFSSSSNDILLHGDMSFDMCITTIFAPLLAKKTINILDGDFSEKNLLKLFNQVRFSTIKLTPSHLRMLKQFHSINLVELTKILIVGGEPFGEDILRYCRLVMPNTLIYNEYGPTETTVGVTIKECSKITNKPTIGTAIAGVKIYILDDKLEPVRSEDFGCIYVAGRQLARGYLNDPVLTAASYIANPFSTDGTRMYKTGDIGRFLENGEIEYGGRTDDQIKINGYRVEIGEIESALAQIDGIKDAIVSTTKDESESNLLIAYYTTEPNLNNVSSALASWKKIYEKLYSSHDNFQNAYFDISGWVDSYSGNQFSYEEMLEWRDNTLQNILALKPKVVFEIGCGTGIIAFSLLGHCAQYIATDFSKNVIDRLQTYISKSNINNLLLYNVDAAESLRILKKHDVDVVVMNSMVQYLPSLEYLEEILVNITKVIGDGTIYIGDIRDYRLAEEFYGTIELHKNGYTSSYQNNIKLRALQEKELLIAPDFFYSLKEKINSITCVELIPLRGRYLNELNLFRYDVIIHFERKEIYKKTGAPEYDVGEIIGLLSGAKVEEFIVREYPNAVLEDISNVTIQSIEGKENNILLIPQQLYAMSKRYGYNLYIALSLRSKYFFNLFFSKKTIDNINAALSLNNRFYLEKHNCSNCPNQVMTAAYFRDTLSRKLSDYMIPFFYFHIKAIPLKKSGKIDKKALPVPSFQTNLRVYQEPINDFELMLSRIWEGILSLRKIGRNDNFFELGGHSLTATQVISDIRYYMKVDIPLEKVFEYPVLKDLAEFIALNVQSVSTLPVISSQYNYSGRHPLSFAQKRLWFLYQFIERKDLYHVCFAVFIKGKIIVDVLRDSLATIVERHRILSYCIDETDGIPYQEMLNKLLNYTEVVVENNEYTRVIQEEISQPFDLKKGQLFRVKRIRLSELENILVFTFHHIIADGWSVGIMVDELNALYNAKVLQLLPHIYDMTFQYIDYVSWQKQMLSPDTIDKQINYWKNKLYGVSGLPLKLSHKKRPKNNLYSGRVFSKILDAQLTEKLYQFANHNNVTLFMVLVSMFQLVLNKLTGDNDVVVGIPVANRRIKEIEKIIGLFVNTIVIRTIFDDDQTFIDLITKAASSIMEDYDNQDVPFEMVVDALEVNRNIAYHPIFQIMFVLQNTKDVKVKLVDTESEVLHLTATAAKFDLVVNITESEKKLIIDYEYSTELFEEEIIENIANYYESALSFMVDHPGTKISEVALTKDIDKLEYFGEENKARVSYSDLISRFISVVHNTPYKSAIILDNNNYITYKELHESSNVVANYLIDHGVLADDVVAVCAEKYLDAVILILGILKANAAYLPLDPNMPLDRKEYILKDSKAKLMLTELDVIDSKNVNTPILNISEINLAYVIYTSGSTGQPKGVAIPHKGFLNTIVNINEKYKVNSEDRTILLSSLSFDLSVYDILGMLIVGGGIVISDEKKDPYDWLRLIKAEKITIWNSVPAFMKMLVNLGLPIDKSLRLVLLSGDKVPIDIKDEIKALSENPDIQLISLGGATEASIWSIDYDINCFDKNKYENVPYGKQLSNQFFYILDNYLNNVSTGVAGKLYIGGVGLARGYINRPDLTAERFIANPFNVGDRLYKTGDLGRFLPDGNIEFLGRIDNQVKIRGFRIELGEIEKVIGEYVREAVVLVKSGENDSKQLVAYIVPKEVEGFSSSSCFKSETGEEISVYEGEEAVALVERIRNELASKLPEYMVPSYFVVLSKLPLNLNGKTDSKILQSLDHGRILLEDEYVAPRNEIEGKLCKIWEEVLKVERVGINDNFFRIGGDSIIAIQVTSRARKGGLIFAVKDLFTNQTISKLSEIIADNDVSEEFTYEAAKSDLDLISVDRHTIEKYIADSESLEDGYLLSPMQEGLLLSGLSLRNDTYFIQNVFYTEFIDIETAKKVWNLVANRHSMLRSGVLFGRAGQNIAYVMKKVDVPFFVSDWSTEELTEKKLQSFISRDREIGFDLSSIPLMRVNIVKLPKNRFLMIWSFHHVLLDGWSASMVLGEVIQAYKAILKNAEMAFVERRPYKDYVGWIKNQDQEKARQFWQKYFVGIETPTQLTFKGAIEKDIADYKSDTFEFNKYETEELHNYAQSNSLTLNTLLIGAIGIILQGYLKQDDIIVGMTASGRSINLPQIEHMVGLFINTVPIRINKNKQGMVKFLSDLQTAIQFASEYGYVSLSSIQKWSGLGRNLFNILFVYENYPIEENCCDDEGLKITKSLGIERIEYPLTVVAMLQEGKLKLRFSYQTEHFNEGNINSIYSSIKNLLLKVAKNEHLDVERIELLTDEEKRQQLVEWNRTEVEYPKHKSIHEIFEKQVRAKPEATAVIFKDQRVTYKELNSRANQLAHHLRKLGVTADTVVGIGVERSIEMIVGILGILKAGGAYLPLDPSYPAARLRYMLEDSKAKLLLIQEGLRESFAGVGVKTISFEEEAEKIAMELQDDLGVPINLLNLAYIIYTSGSTGQPKGVQIVHAGLVNFVLYIHNFCKLKTESVVLQFSKLIFDASVFDIFCTLTIGATIYLIDAKEKIIDAISAKEIDIALIPPSVLRNLGVEINNLTTLITGGEALSTDTAIKCQYVKNFINAYGPTEATVCGSMHILESSNEPSIIGQPAANIKIFILDENMSLVSAGLQGEIHIAGVGLARGYLGRQDLTAEKFIANPFGSGDRLYKTGDLGRYRFDGRIEFLGRIDEQVKINGIRIELGEIQHEINKYVENCVVHVKGNANGNYLLICYLVPSNVTNLACLYEFESQGKRKIKVFHGKEVDSLINKILSSLYLTLPDYMIPKLFLVLNTIPLNINGKTDINLLHELPVNETLYEDNYMAPRNKIEEKLCEIWREVLKVDRIGINDSFFKIGGDSISALHIASKIRQKGLIVEVADIFAEQTIAKLALVTKDYEEEKVIYNKTNDEAFNIDSKLEIFNITKELS